MDGISRGAYLCASVGQQVRDQCWAVCPEGHMILPFPLLIRRGFNDEITKRRDTSKIVYTRETHGVEQGEVNFQKRLNYLIEKRKFKFNR